MLSLQMVIRYEGGGSAMHMRDGMLLWDRQVILLPVLIIYNMEGEDEVNG